MTTKAGYHCNITTLRYDTGEWVHQKGIAMTDKTVEELTAENEFFKGEVEYFTRLAHARNEECIALAGVIANSACTEAIMGRRIEEFRKFLFEKFGYAWEPEEPSKEENHEKS